MHARMEEEGDLFARSHKKVLVGEPPLEGTPSNRNLHMQAYHSRKRFRGNIGRNG